MIIHIVRMSIRPDVTEEQLGVAMQRMAEASIRMNEEAVATGGTFGRDFGDTFDYAAVSTIASIAEYEAMLNHPAHLEVDRTGLPLVDRFHSIDVTDDPDTEIGAKIAAIHRRRFEAHPDLLELVLGIEEYRGSGVPGRD